MRASTETSRMLTEYYAAMEAKDQRVFGSYYAEDMTLTFGNSPEVKGRDNIISTFNDALDKVVSLGHDLVNAWEEDGGVVFFESIGRWTLNNGVVIEIKAASKITVVDGPYPESKETIVSFALIQAASKEEAIELSRRFWAIVGDGEGDIRQVYGGPE